MLEKESLSLLNEATSSMEKMFNEMPEFVTDIDMPAIREVLLSTAERLQDNYPYPHPLYAGQMLKPPHPIARLAYTLSLWINPNNHALDGGKASSIMEKECIHHLAQMIGWNDHLGHLCSGGTVANLEALWVASTLTNGKKVVASQQAHYTHARLSSLLRIPFEAVPCNPDGQMDCQLLEKLLQTGDVGTVVASIGTTATGAVDPLSDILELQTKYNFRLHADAAYGGYFILVDNLDAKTRDSFENLKYADSIVIDPHKHGLQPYGCGCVIFKDKSVARVYKHDSPYTYYTSDELHLGEISLECSRPGASAVALWATQKLLPMTVGGKFASMLAKSRQAALDLYSRLSNDTRFLVGTRPQLDIVIWMPSGKSASEISQKSKKLFQACAEHKLFFALADIPVSFFPDSKFTRDQNDVTCLRACLIKPDHLNWLEEIWQRMEFAFEQLN